MPGSSDDEEDVFSEKEIAIVEGAGLEAVNGEYYFQSLFDGTVKYNMDGMWRNQNHEFSLYRCSTGDGRRYWYISIIPSHVEPGTSADIDFYSAPVDYLADRDYPPRTGWTPFGEGILPPPTISLRPRMSTSEQGKAPTVPVAAPVAATHKGMLFSDDFSDCRFVCPDGETIPAHKFILAKSSAYFKAAFSGQWQDTSDLNTTHPSAIIKAMLTILYTGDTNVPILEQDPIAFLGVASEYDLGWLKKLVEPNCVKNLRVERLKDVWQAGRLFDSVLLKSTAISFAKKNALAVLKHGDITTLQVADPASWNEFVRAL